MKHQILTRIMNLLPSDAGMRLPPKVFLDMNGEFIEFIEGQKLVARYPNMDRYANPFGFMQGGIIVAAMDNTVSPLSYMVAPTNITSGIEATFKRPIKGADPFIDVIATVVSRGDSAITLQAEVLNAKGKRAAIGFAKGTFIKGRRHDSNGF